MKHHIFFAITAFLLSSNTHAQHFVKDADVSETVMLKDDNLKIFYFTASWCKPCKEMEPFMKEIHAAPDLNVTVYKMDIDTNITDDILKIKGVPTLLFMKNGVVLDSMLGGISKDYLIKLIDKNKNKAGTGKALHYLGEKSTVKLVLGNNEKLTRKNLEKLWYSAKSLNKLSRNITEVLNDPRDLKCALSLTNRSIELEESYTNLELKAILLYKLYGKKSASEAIAHAKNRAKKDNANTSYLDYILN